MSYSNTREQLVAENETLREQLAESQQVIEAIRSNRVDAFVVEKPLGEEVCFLSGAERLAEEAASIGYLRWGLPSGRVDISPGLLRICGLELEASEQEYAFWLQQVHPDDRAGLQARQREVFSRREELFQYEYRIRRSDGTIRSVEERSSVTYDGNGEPVRVIGVIVDVTERWETQRALTQAEAAADTADRKLKVVLAGISDAFALIEMVYDGSGRPLGFRFLDANAALERQTSLKPEEILGKDVREVLPGLECHWLEAFHRVASTGEPVHLEEFSSDLGGWYYVRAYCPEPGQAALVISNVTPRRRAQEALRESEERFRTMADGLPLIIWVHDARGELQFVNRTFCEYFGTSYEAMRDSRWQMLMHPEDAPAYRDEFSDCVRQRRPFHAEVRVQRADGQWRWLESWGRPRFSSSGEFLGIVGTSADMTERKQVENDLAAARAHAEEANRAKSQFLANMSHELRTPMNAILGMTDLALREDLAPAVRDYLRTAKDSADVLLELLDQLLDFSRIEAGQLELETYPFDLRNAITQVAKSLGVRAGEKGLELICDLADQLPERVVGDPLRLRQVLINLVSNAIKFTERGEVVIRAAVQSTADGVATMEFSVADTGVGIAPKDLQRIFSPFTQADASTTRHHGGSGLGLAIVANLVELMGGRIRVESEPGRGSTFSFTVALQLQPDAEPEAVPPPLGQEALRGLPMLIVVENATSRYVLQRTLAGWGIEPELVGDVSAGLIQLHQAAAAGRKFQLVLADSALPGIDGFTLADWLVRSASLACPIVLMLSGHERSSRAELCRTIGAVCVEKPASPSELLEAITRALGMQGPASGSFAAEGRDAPARALRVLLAEDTPANQKLVMYLLSRRGHVVEVAGNGHQALELCQQKDFDLILMDVQMPILDGFQATQAIRALPGPRSRVPIVAMTAHALRGDAERCLDAGMNAYISKPIDGDAVIELVERLADSSDPEDADHAASGGTVREPAASEPPTSETATDPPTDEIFNLDQAVGKCFGDYTLFQKMVAHFFQEADELVDQMQTAIARGDTPELSQLAHRLKNTVAYLGTRPATEAIRHLEQVANAGQLAQATEAVHQLRAQLELVKQAVEPHRPADPPGADE